MNILLFTPLSLEYGRGGEIFIMELAAGLNKYYNIHLIDTNILPEEKTLTEKKINKKLKDLHEIERIYYATLKFLGRTFTFPYPWEVIKLYRRIKKSDIVYFAVSSIRNNFILLLSKLIFRNTSYIIGYHKPFNLKKFISLYNLKYRISICMISLFKKRVFHHTVSSNAKKFLGHFYAPQKIIHINNSVDLRFFLSQPQNQNEKNLNFIYVGHLDSVHKGVDVLLSGIENFLEENPDLPLQFDFCGKGPLAKRLDLLEKRFSNKIIFHGYIDHNLIPKYYNKNDVFLFTSRREPFGIVIIEALAAGLLIICTKTIGSIEILKGQRFAFFLKTLTVKEIKRKILEVYDLWKTDINLFNKLRANARKHSQKYSLSLTLDQFHKFFERIRLNLLENMD